ncbi:50S ribosomal protein L29 [Patescibacteria group bacterium]|nr:50S ribosomal protein L29 [Patescibacteria group bacterium]
MLLYSEITQLSDRDLLDEIENTRNSLFRQKMGVRTKHLKDTHLVKALRKYVAQLLTELRRRKKLDEKVETTSSEVAKKAKEMHSEIEKAQTPKKKKTEKKVEEAEKVEEKVEAKSSEDVKVKKVEKKGFFSRKKKTEEKDS